MEKAIYSVQLVEGMGRGVIAERDIKLGEIITNCELLLLSPEDTIKVNETDLQWYTFTFDKNSKQDCLVLGDGEIFNHDDNANVLYGLIDWNGRKLMRFQASRDINKGEQLFIDYRADVDNVDNVLESYTINLI
jgi:SET domain-containing protein